jgi:hypothetical protein
MQLLEKVVPVIARLSREDHLDRHSRDNLIGAIADGDHEAVKPVIVIVECLADFDACFFLVPGSDNFDWFDAPGLPRNNPALLLRLGMAVSEIHRLPG